MPGNYPIMLTKSINCDRDRTIVEYGITIFSGEMMELAFYLMDNGKLLKYFLVLQSTLFCVVRSNIP